MILSASIEEWLSDKISAELKDEFVNQSIALLMA